MGIARARRDLGCRYTLGVYDRKPGDFRARDVRVDVSRSGLHALHSEAYSFRSPQERRRDGLMAAWMAPSMFAGGVVRAHLFPLSPREGGRWASRLALEFPTAMLGKHASVESFNFGAIVRSGRRVVHLFGREVRLESRDGAALASRMVSFFQDLVLPPGPYDVTVVAEGAEGEKIFSASVQTALPDIIPGEPFLVGPFLGRRAGRDVVVHGGARKDGKTLVDDPTRDRLGSPESLTPILVHEIPKSESIAASTLACLVARRKPSAPFVIERGLVTRAGSPAGTLDPVTAALAAEGKTRCDQTLDVLPVGSLRAGAYRFEARLRAPGATSPLTSSIPFAVVPAAPPTPAADDSASDPASSGE